MVRTLLEACLTLRLPAMKLRTTLLTVAVLCFVPGSIDAAPAVPAPFRMAFPMISSGTLPALSMGRPSLLRPHGGVQSRRG